MIRRYIPHYLLVLALSIVAPLLANAAAGPEYCDAPVLAEPAQILAPANMDKPVPIEPQAAALAVQTAKAHYPLTDAERDLIAETCHYEDGVHGLVGMIGVAETVMNRIKSEDFPNTVEGVCVPSQFHGLWKNGTEAIRPEAYEAVEIVFDRGCSGWTQGALYFCTPDTDPDAIKPGLVETTRIGGHVFYADKEDRK